MENNVNKQLDEKFNAYLRQNLSIDKIYALVAALFFGCIGGFIMGAECADMFLTKCMAYYIHWFRFAIGFLAVGSSMYYVAFKAARARRRRKGWFG